MKRNLIVLGGLALLVGCVSVDLETERAGAVSEAADRLALTGPEAPAALAAPISAPAAVRHALARNEDFRAGLADLGLARAAWAQASRPDDPVLELVWFPEDGEEDFLEIELSGAVVNILATPWRARSAEQRYDAARRQAVLQTLDFIAEVQSGWVGAVAANQRLELQQRIVQASEASLLVAENLFEAGNIPPIELERERVFAGQSRLTLMQAELEAGQAARRLSILLGGHPVRPADLPTRLDHPEHEFDWTELDAATALNLVVEERRLVAEALAREAGIEDFASLLPHGELGLIAEREDGHWENGFALETAPPIFDFGRARRASARIRAVQGAERYRAALARLERTNEITQAEWEGALARADRLRAEQLPAVDRLLDRSMRQYNAMQLGVFELIQVYQLTAETGLAYVDALESAHIAAIQARHLLAGGLPDIAAGGGGSTAPAAVREAGGH